MVELKYLESNYRFTDPIRYFKANDPYYYEVDNIPLKQLQENSLWLKDQVTNLKIDDIDRSSFSELKPYVNGVDNLVYVKPGRFTARVNDAYRLTPLQSISLLLGTELSDYNTWEAVAINNVLIKSTIDQFKAGLTADALNMNGLVERAFTYPAREPDIQSQYIDGVNPTIVDLAGTMRQAYPGKEAQLWAGDATQTSFVIRQYDPTNPVVGFASLGVAEVAFVKRWRGIARTAVVDLAEETSIEIPPFDANDFFYIDENGLRQPLESNQRIDLVFIYSKPIDVSSTTIAKFVNNQPTTITKPVLGIVRGAGIGADFSRVNNNIRNSLKVVNATKADGTPLMLANPGDESGENTGFTASGITGSFPSPDDLMNLAPQLAEELESDNLALIGQSILPIAYVVVRKAGSINESGVNVITSDDLIDIRPFFRTTELTYNERAGLAAAVPAPSIANPVVTQAELDFEVKRPYFDLKARIQSLEGNTGDVSKPRVVGAGYVKGGFNFGVEGTLARFIENRISPGLTKERLKQEIISRYGLPSTMVIPDYPDWDLGYWVNRNNLTDPGSYPNDYVNIHMFQRGLANNANSAEDAEFGPYQDKNLTVRLNRLGTDNVFTADGPLTIYYVKKTINLDRGSVPWMGDYHVDVQLWNCAPLSCRAGSPRNYNAAGINSIWVEKNQSSFTIYVAWVANDFFSADENLVNANIGAQHMVDLTRTREGHWVAGFVVINQDIANASYSNSLFTGESNAGISIYPSVTFQVIGYPTAYDGLQLDLNTLNPTITLK